MHKYLKTSLINIFLFLPVLHSARILGIFPVHSRSHHSINQPIVKRLAERGHNVTIISHFTSKISLPNYKEIVIERGTSSFIDSISVDDAHLFNGVQNLLYQIVDVEYSSCIEILKSDFIKGLIQSNKKQLDLIVAEEYFTQCYNLLAERLDVPLISLTPATSGTGNDLMIGNPGNPAVVPVITTSYTTQMGFFQRIVNTYHFLRYYFGFYFSLNNYMNEVAKKYFNSHLASPQNLQRRVALTFYNNHFSLIPRVAAPNAIDIGGIHIQEAKPLPEHIKNFIDEAKNGVIFFSFGTTIKASSIPIDKMNIIKRVFSRIPQRILWRIDNPRVTSFPVNVMADHWYPQRDILEQKNVFAFISHCGIFGTMEAIYTATPVITIPFLFDQEQNANILVEKGMAIHISYDTLTEDKLLSAINEIINNTKYRRNAEALSSVFKDRPISPLETAIYWTEYVLKHNGAPHLRLQSADMPLYKYLLLDVIAFFLIITTIMIWVLKNLLLKIFIHLRQTSNRNKIKNS